MPIINDAIDEFAERTVSNAAATYRTSEGRAALRCALMDAANLCDMIGREITKGKRTSQALTEKVELLKEIVDKLEAMRASIEVPRR